MTKAELRKALDALDHITDEADASLLAPLGFVRSALLWLWQRSRCRAVDGAGLMEQLRRLARCAPPAAMSCLAQAVCCLCASTDDLRLCADHIRLLRLWRAQCSGEEEQLAQTRLLIAEETFAQLAAVARARAMQANLQHRMELDGLIAQHQRALGTSALMHAADEARMNAAFVREKLFACFNGSCSGSVV